MRKLISTGLAAAMFLSISFPVLAQSAVSGDLRVLSTKEIGGGSGCGPYFKFIAFDGPGTSGTLSFAFKDPIIGNALITETRSIPLRSVIIVIDNTRTLPWVAWRPGHTEIRLSAKHRAGARCLVHGWPVQARPMSIQRPRSFAEAFAF